MMATPRCREIDEDLFKEQVKTHSVLELAEKYGVARRTMANWACIRGLRCKTPAKHTYVLPKNFAKLTKTMTAREISDMTSCPPCNIRARAKRMGLQCQPDKWRPNNYTGKIPVPTREEFIKQATEMTSEQMRRLHHCSIAVVQAWANQYDFMCARYCPICEENRPRTDFINQQRVQCWRHHEDAEELAEAFALAKRHWGTPSMLPVRRGWPTQDSGLSV